MEFSLLGASNKVVTNTQRFEFIQTEAVSDKVLPRTVVIATRWRTSDQQRQTSPSDRWTAVPVPWTNASRPCLNGATTKRAIT